MKEMLELNDPNLLSTLFRQLFKNSTDPLFLVDTAFIFSETNSAFKELFEMDSESADSFSLENLFQEADVFKAIKAQIEKEGKIKEQEVHLIDSKGHGVFALLSLLPIKNETQKIIGHQGIIHDETARAKAQHTLDRTQRIAMTGRMVRSIAHEIRNPLTNVTLAIASLKDSKLSENDQFMVSLVEKNAARINDQITQLLDSSRPPELSLEEVEIRLIIDPILERMKEQMNSSGVGLLVNYPKTETRIMADKDKAQMAFYHLLKNAIEAMKDGGKLCVTVIEKEEGICVQIQDNGIGMSSTLMPHIYDPFYTDKHGSVGLGLTSAHTIFEGHGWPVDVKSKEGVGTTFTVTI